MRCKSGAAGDSYNQDRHPGDVPYGPKTGKGRTACRYLSHQEKRIPRVKRVHAPHASHDVTTGFPGARRARRGNARAMAPKWEACGTPWERACDGTYVGSVRNADRDAQTVGSVVNSYMHGAQLAKGATAAIEHSERWKTILIDYIPHKPTDDPYAYPYPSPHHRPSTAVPIHRRSHPPPKSSTAAPIYRPTHPSLVSRSQAHLVNVLDNGKSSKEGALTARRFSSILSPSYRCHECNHRISRAGAREETRIRKLRDL
jgi:hypothetical protein